ncbi:A24 family peptidase [Aquibacillus salsiterrae]|uniref:Prepilin peptidase n=1 Tax=Aquibacillus salsiterrae TaxID=2950439 RepID=A0A9X3WC06_9BACI|nr:prepilin peptidase [Aquibacillus salsiterrae]MDC3416945.1 prepilin peptidase [Aquibacillus salsiterrae]
MILNTLLFIILSICVITDLKSRKIYNKVIFPSFILALLFHIIIDGLSGLTSSLLGFVVGFALLLIPYLMGGMGAGDVKLLALIGAIKGVSFVLVTAIYMALIGGVIGLVLITFRKGACNRIKYMIYSLCGIKYGMKMTVSEESLKGTYPYGVAIAFAALFSFYMNGASPLW